MFRAGRGPRNAPSPTRRPTSTSRSAPPQSGELLIKRMAGLLRAGTLTGAAVTLQAVTIIENWLRQLNFAQQVPNSILNLMEAVAAQMRKLAARPHRRRREHPHADGGHRHRHHDRGRALQGPGPVRRPRPRCDQPVRLPGMAPQPRRHQDGARLPLPDRDLRLRLRLRGRRAPEAASRRRRGGARGAADVLHLSRRDVLARALRHGRRRLRTALQGAGRAGPTARRPRRSGFTSSTSSRPSSSPTRAAVTSRRCVSGRTADRGSWTG